MSHGTTRSSPDSNPSLRPADPSPLTPRPSLIFLIGSRGSGKTTTARLLADRLGWMWVDADDVVEQRHGMSIRELFAAGAEGGFRDKEAAVLADLCRMRRHVVATGGGVVLRPDNRELIKKSGWSVWLTADVETLWQRLQDDPATVERRPQLTVGGIKEIADVLRAREETYRNCADCTVLTSGRSPQLIVDDIYRAWNALGAC
jgi:shikimate kinase